MINIKINNKFNITILLISKIKYKNISKTYNIYKVYKFLVYYLFNK